MTKGKRRFSCQQDPQTGIVVCESQRVFEDGTTQTLAHVDFQFDAQCRPVPTNLVEVEDGELDRLHKKVMPILKSKCKSTPTDY